MASREEHTARCPMYAWDRQGSVRTANSFDKDPCHTIPTRISHPPDVLWPTYSPRLLSPQGAGARLPDIVGLLVTGQHGACDGLLQVLPLLPQDLLEVIFQGLHDITQKQQPPGQVLALWQKRREVVPVSRRPAGSALRDTKSKGRPRVNKCVCP